MIDLRSLRPLDDATIMTSVARTQRAVIVDEGWRSGSLSAEIGARIIEQAFYELDAPVGRVCSAEVPIPYASHLEKAALPQAAADRRGGEGRAWASVRTARGRVPHALAGRRHGGGHAGRMAGEARRSSEARRHRRRGRDQKGAIEIEIFETGQIEQILVDLNSKVPVGTPLALIRTELETAAGVAPRAGRRRPPSHRRAASRCKAVPARLRPRRPLRRSRGARSCRPQGRGRHPLRGGSRSSAGRSLHGEG